MWFVKLREVSFAWAWVIEALTPGGRKRISDTYKVPQVGTATSDSPEDTLEDTESWTLNHPQSQSQTVNMLPEFEMGFS